MNRRELLQSVVGIAAASGVTVHASTVEADAKPALALFELDGPVEEDEAVYELIYKTWEGTTQGTPFEGTRALVLASGVRLTLLDAAGRPLNRRVEDEP